MDEAPHSLEAERSVLGAVLLDNAAIGQLDGLRPLHFFGPGHRRIFAAAEEIIKGGAKVDLVTLHETLETAGQLEAVGGSAYLASLLDGVPNGHNVAAHARILRDHAARRAAIDHADRLREAATQPRIELAELHRLAQATEESIGRAAVSDVAIRSLTDIPGAGQIEPVDTRWIADGFLPESGLTMIAGPPGSCKSWLVMTLARAVGDRRQFLERRTESRQVIIFDRENPQSLILDRLEMFGMSGDNWDNPRVWGGWMAEQPPLIGDPRLREWAKFKPVYIFDSFVRFHGGADENSAAEMAKVMGELRMLCNLGASVVVVHHRGKTESVKYRGSSDILAAVDLAFSLSRTPDGSALVLEVFKNRFGREWSARLEPDFDSGGFRVSYDSEPTKDDRMRTTLRNLIEESPGLSTREILKRCGLPQRRAHDLLRRYVGVDWKAVQGVANRAIFYQPLATPETPATAELEL